MDFMSWTGVDLDGTLAECGTDASPMNILTIGKPIEGMVMRVREWIRAGREVRIVTARVGNVRNDQALAALAPLTQGQAAAVGLSLMDLEAFNANGFFELYQRRLIVAWCERHLGQALVVTAAKDFEMTELWDDRAVQVLTNKGLTVYEAVGLRLAGFR